MTKLYLSGLGESAFYAHSTCVFSVLVSPSPLECKRTHFEKIEMLILFGYLIIDEA